MNTKPNRTVIATILIAFLYFVSHAQQIGDRIYSPPPVGNYFSMAHTNWPPSPYLIIPEAPVYYLGTVDGAPGYAYDDRDFESGFDSEAASVPPPPPGDGGGSTNVTMPPTIPFAPLLDGLGSCDDYGKRFWFSSITLTSGAVRLTLTNTVAGFVYGIWRATNLGNPRLKASSAPPSSLGTASSSRIWPAMCKDSPVLAIPPQPPPGRSFDSIRATPAQQQLRPAQSGRRLPFQIIQP